MFPFDDVIMFLAMLSSPAALEGVILTTYGAADDLSVWVSLHQFNPLCRISVYRVIIVITTIIIIIFLHVIIIMLCLIILWDVCYCNYCYLITVVYMLTNFI